MSQFYRSKNAQEFKSDVCLLIRDPRDLTDMHFWRQTQRCVPFKYLYFSSEDVEFAEMTAVRKRLLTCLQKWLP